MTITEDRPPARILEGGTFPLPGFPGCQLTYGHDAVLETVSLLANMGWLAVDIETEGLGVLARRVKVVTLATPTHAVLFDPRDPAQFMALRDIFQAVDELVFHNSPFDVPPLAHIGVLTVADARKVTDTLIWARLANPDERGDRSLANAARTYLEMAVEDGVTARAKRLGMTKSQYFLQVDLNSPAYRWDAASDGIATARLKDVVRRAALERITTGHPFSVYGVTGDEAERLVDREQRINRMTMARTIKGLRWDPDHLDAYRDAKSADVATWETELEAHGIRPTNAADLTAYLERIGELPADWPRTDTGRLSGEKANLEKLDHPLAQTFLRHKETVRVDDLYLAKVRDLADANGRIHPAVNIFGGKATGRMSISDPPLQQFDAAARGIILADEGDELVSIDWSQIEPVIAANIAGDTAVLSRYEDNTLAPKERDAYLGIAEFAGISRSQAKVVLLAQMYGEGLLTLAKDLGFITTAEAGLIRKACDDHDLYPSDAAERLGVAGFRRAVEVKDMVFKAMPATAGLIKKLKTIGREHRVVFTMSGRILPIPMSQYRGQWGPQAHKAVNYVIQGSAYDLLAETLIRVDEAGLADAVYLAMHDELVVSKSAAHDIERIMQTPPERLVWMAGRTPVLRTDRADLGERWAKC
ncbi:MULTISPECIES: DNA polymerase [unclassified Nonomuraea]|uniref:DNA polymerase n=1 Tax=unclassified Nonomuraea TaxID=2593643 RepID=UPI0033D56110